VMCRWIPPRPLRPATLLIPTAGILGLLILAAAPSQPAAAQGFTATVYDDGLACPGNCDAHVVFASRHNGTRMAFRPPLQQRSAPAPCAVGRACIVCFSEANDSCIEVIYRGDGPSKNRFDFTPAFFAANCGRQDLPRPIAELCKALVPLAARYAKRINCFAEPERAECLETMRAAEAAKAIDRIERNACLPDPKAYNIGQTDPTKRRSLGCNYELTPTGRNKKGVTWHKLLPAACRDGTYVDPSGEDCCSAEVYAAAHFHPMCAAFFPRTDHQRGPTPRDQ
jgi:hypothetical protein